MSRSYGRAMNKPSFRNHRPVRRRQYGATLIEVLVAVLILGIGLLGIAAMQAIALRNTQSSMERSQAVIQSYAALDLLRARRDEASLGQLDINPMQCDPGNVVDDERRAWVQGLQGTLGAGACGRIQCISNPVSKCSITVQWDDSRGAQAPISLVTETRL